MGRRADGLHCLESLFWPIRLGDEIELKPASENSVRMVTDTGEEISAVAQKDNLVWKVLERLQLPEKWAIVIKKQIPMGGGLGGGSSNCGTLLRFLVETGRLLESEAEMLAPTFGADVPYFLNPVPSWVTGIGEVRSSVSVPAAARAFKFLVVLLPQGAETARVFRHFKEANTPLSSKTNPPVFSSDEEVLDYLKSARNDLVESASHEVPLIKQVLEKLASSGALAYGMSGSGSTCYAIYRSSQAREESAQVLQPFFRSHYCKSLFVETL